MLIYLTFMVWSILKRIELKDAKFGVFGVISQFLTLIGAPNDFEPKIRKV